MPSGYGIFLIQYPPVFLIAGSDFLKRYRRRVKRDSRLRIVSVGEGVGLDFLEKVKEPVLLVETSRRHASDSVLENIAGNKIFLTALREQAGDEVLRGYAAFNLYLKRCFGDY